MAKLRPIVADTDAIAYCGLYCGSCRAFLKGSCQGCKRNEKATWCQVRTCCIEHDYRSCAECEGAGIDACSDLNNIFSKVIGFVLRSDRKACLRLISEEGYPAFARKMATEKRQSLPRGSR